MKFLHRLSAVAALAIVPMLSHAALVTYNFTVTATTGSLSGQTSTGYFTYDSPNAWGGAKLTDLHFVWNGITYDETTANTGVINEKPGGGWYALFFGPDCSDTHCIANTHTWIVMNDYFGYSEGGNRQHGTTTYQLRVDETPDPGSQIPEPGSIALSSLALGVMGLTVARRRKAGRHAAQNGRVGA